MAALYVGVLRAHTIVGVADERWWYGGGHESLAGDGVDPVGGAGAGGKIMRDGLRISCVLSHQAKERREGGPRVAETFIDNTTLVPSLLLISELALAQLNRSPSQRVSNEENSFLIFSPSFYPFHSPLSP